MKQKKIFDQVKRINSITMKFLDDVIKGRIKIDVA